jgi:NAD(P)-dependent dehydrogenase (short-subunit alcohol dehydrogenase family)
MSDFAGKSVMVLGGSRGIGAAIVRHFASAGAKVIFTYAGSADAAAMAIKRHAHADEVADLVLFLAGPKAAMITGTTHTIDGGFGA